MLFTSAISYLQMKQTIQDKKKNKKIVKEELMALAEINVVSEMQQGNTF